MNKDDRTAAEENGASRENDESTRERSAEERSIVAPTPKDVRAKSDRDDQGPRPPAPGDRRP
ncbi:hypothetical protein GCM10009665_45370 [Kitasatospora nipponensis]|uniref:Uncharacterized protein n=1 Tax=Kitasatospora nipponensis TaxID=258049 RepID=A0ABP4H761_9ACTN